jgi:hypothetical protein
MNMLKMCLNWKVVVGLAALGAGIFLVAPDVASAALPYLVLAICPISMLLIMVAMNHGKAGERRASPEIDGGLAREGQITRLREHEATLTEQIRALERDEWTATRDGDQRRGSTADAR